MVEADSHLKLLPASTLDIWPHWYAVHGYEVAALKRYSHLFGWSLGFWVTSCGVKMMSLRHGWGWLPTQTTSCHHIIHIKSVWAHWHAVHGHMAVASNSYTHTTWFIFWGSGSLVESKCCHYIMVEADSPLQTVTHIQTIHITSVWANWHAVHDHIAVVSNSYTHTSASYFLFLGHLWIQNDVITSWLRLTATSNCFPHPY